MDFETFYGDGWDDSVEKKFNEWALRVYGGKYFAITTLAYLRLTLPKRGTVNGGTNTFSPETRLLRPRNQRLKRLSVMEQCQRLPRPLRPFRHRTHQLRPLRRRTHPLRPLHPKTYLFALLHPKLPRNPWLERQPPVIRCPLLKASALSNLLGRPSPCHGPLSGPPMFLLSAQNLPLYPLVSILRILPRTRGLIQLPHQSIPSHLRLLPRQRSPTGFEIWGSQHLEHVPAETRSMVRQR